MDPNQQPVQPQHQLDPSQYDFIMNGAQKPKKPLIPVPRAGSSKVQRLLFVAGAGILLIIVASVVFSFISRASNSSIDALVVVAQKQAEVLRVANLGLSNASSSRAKNVAVSTELTTTSQQQQLLAYLNKKGRKLKPKELSAGISSQTDSQLAAAVANGHFDDTYLQILRTDLAAYQQQLKTASASQGKDTKAWLTDDANQVDLLLLETGK